MRSPRRGTHRVIGGPPGSGKTHQILTAVRAHLEAGETSFRLLTPTTTMAEHIRNQLARGGFTFPAACVMTFGRFVASMTSGVETVSRGALEIFVESAIARQRRIEFEPVAGLPGFRRLVRGVCEELASAGCDAKRLRNLIGSFDPPDPLGDAVASIYSEVERRLAERGLAMRSERLSSATAHLKVFGSGDLTAIYLDGFFQFTQPELDLIEALAGACSCTVTLPSWPGAQPTRERLISGGFTLEEQGAIQRSPDRTAVFSAGTAERECEEVARRILQMSQAGRPFRDIGVIVRSQQPYVPVLRAALERFRIPARFYFSEPLADHSAIRFLESAFEAMLSGWDHGKALEAITSSASGLAGKAAAYEFEFAVREQLPGSGLDSLSLLSPGIRSVKALLRLFEQLDDFRTGVAAPRVWAERLAKLRPFFRGPSPSDPADRENIEKWQLLSAALDKLEDAVAEVLRALDSRTDVTFAQFWAALRTIIGASEVRIQDRRRNVVHVMDVYEARQWQLPVTFVCGLVEKQFPKYRQRPPLFPDETRWQLQRSGINLRTTADWAVEEEFLFDIAISRASENLILSYPEQSAAGDPLLRSFALERLLASWPQRAAVEPAGFIRPEPHMTPPRVHGGNIADTVLLESIRAKHLAVSPSSIETFLQCPFQFYARKTLKLRARPERPEDRLSALIQGGIIHAVLSRLDGTGTLEDIFEETCSLSLEENRILPGYRAETIKLEMFRALRLFRDEGMLPAGWTSSNEVPFEFEIEPDLRLRGRIDRLLIDPGGRALVIDFKYSSKANVDKCVSEHERGFRVQGGLYMLAAESMGHRPAGMLYAGLRKELSWRGWHASIPELVEFGVESRSQAGLREVMEQARSQAISAAAGIRSGVIAPAPAVADKCRYCDYADICRIDVPATLAVTAGTMPYDVE